MRKILFVVLFVLQFSSIYGQPKQGQPGSKGSYLPESFASVLSEDHNVKDGPYELWYEGVRIIGGNYSRGKKSGLWRFVNTSSSVSFIGNYINDEKSGGWKYYKDKKILCSIWYKGGLKDSTWRSYYITGALMSEQSYSNGCKNGIFKTYYEDGKVASVVNYVNDSVDGICKTFYPDSTLKSLIEYNKGCVYNVNALFDSLGRKLDFGTLKNGTGKLKLYYNNGAILSESEFENGLYNGSVKKYSKAGVLVSESHFKNGLEDSIQVNYLPTGDPYEEINFIRGARSGVYKSYFPNKKLNILGEYRNGIPVGKWHYYNLQGKEFQVITYKENSAVERSVQMKGILKDPLDDVVVSATLPMFHGDEAELAKFVFKHLEYPQYSKENGIQGAVFLSFIVSDIGYIDDIKIEHGLNEELNAAALKSINLLPPWSPGFLNGFPQGVHFSFPVKFRLD